MVRRRRPGMAIRHRAGSGSDIVMFLRLTVVSTDYLIRTLINLLVEAAACWSSADGETVNRVPKKLAVNREETDHEIQRNARCRRRAQCRDGVCPAGAD